MVTITLYARQKKRHRCTEQSFELCGRRQRWDVLREQHRNLYIIKCETDHQSRLDAWDKCSGLVHWEDPEGWDEGASRGELHLDHVQSSTRGPPRRREKAICRGICHGHRVQPRLLLSLPLSSPPSLAPSSPRGSHQQLREREGKWGSLGERQDDHSWPPLVLTEKIKSTTWELRAKFYLGAYWGL